MGTSIQLKSADGFAFDAYVAQPAQAAKAAVVILQEIFGVNDHIRKVADGYAQAGYLAIAPATFARAKTGVELGYTPDDMNAGFALKTAIENLPAPGVMADIQAAVDYAAAQTHGKVGVVGYCWGGRTAWLYARHNPQLKAAVAYYGLLNGMKSDIKPADPVDFAAEIKVPVLGLYAGTDAFVKPEVIDQMRAGIAKSGSGSEIVVFPNVNHGFNADYRPTYDKGAALYAQKLASEWLKDHGV